MNATKPETIVRARPHLGTVVRIEVQGVSHDIVTGAFEEIARLEKIFNFHDPLSVLSRFNNARDTERGSVVESTPEFHELLEICDAVTKLSSGYFRPLRDKRLDLSGIAKGFIVDKTVEWILHEAVRSDDNSTNDVVRGSINAGGDLRFFSSNAAQPVPMDQIVLLRLGTADKAFAREMKLCRPCVATSSPFAFNERVYFEILPRAHSAVVQADRAAIADALTKVALFAPQERLEMCCEEFSAVAMLFDENGELVA